MKSGVEYKTTTDHPTTQDWELPKLTLEYVHEKLEGLRKSKSNCFLYPWGVWITAYARKRLWDVIQPLDDLVIYYDTDSIKHKVHPLVDEVIADENEKCKLQMISACDDLGIDISLLSPKDQKGNEHFMGLWEDEPDHFAKYFITLGAKRYADMDREENLHCVVSGVSNKKGYLALKGDISNFTNGLVFDYESADKLISFYNDEQPDIIFKDYLGQVYRSKQRHGICLQPAQYSMSISQDVENQIEENQNGFKEGEWIK